MATATNNIPIPTEVVAAGPQVADSGIEFHNRMASISRQSAIYFAGTILTTAAGFFFKVFLARSLGAEPLGIYTLGMTIVGVLGVFNALGLPTAATRFVSCHLDQHWISLARIPGSTGSKRSTSFRASGACGLENDSRKRPEARTADPGGARSCHFFRSSVWDGGLGICACAGGQGPARP